MADVVRVHINEDSSITLVHETQTPNPADGSMTADVPGEVTMTAGQWRTAVGGLTRALDQNVIAWVSPL